MKLLPATDCSS